MAGPVVRRPRRTPPAIHLGAPGAVARAKALARSLGPVVDDTVIRRTVGLLADAWETPEAAAFWAEVVLEGLHQKLKLAREDLDSVVTYREMLKFQLLKPRKGGRGGPAVN